MTLPFYLLAALSAPAVGATDATLKHRAAPASVVALQGESLQGESLQGSESTRSSAAPTQPQPQPPPKPHPKPKPPPPPCPNCGMG
jgi:hypothetical protein